MMNLTMRRAAAMALCLVALGWIRAGAALAQFDNTQAIGGLREALTTGTGNAVELVGRPGGYFSNPAIKIGFPRNLTLVEKGLRGLGYGPQIDEFVHSMNSAAEAAAPKARPIFVQAIQNMSFADARRIIAEPGHPATDYFQRKTTAELTAAFTPIVKQEMARYSVTRQYDNLIGHYQGGTLGSLSGLLGGSGGAKPSLDLDSYVVNKALDGLFYEVGQQEEQIRTNPAARVTPLLKTIFGHGN